MKIIHALGWFFPDSLGGTETYVAGLAHRLLRAGHEVAVAAPSPGAAAPQSYVHEDIPVFRYPIPLHPGKEECQARVLSTGFPSLREWIRAERPDVLHVHTLTHGLNIMELEELKGMGPRIVVTNHLGSIGYICLRGTLMRWGKEVCDGLPAQVKCASCMMQKLGVPRFASVPLAMASRLAGDALERLPGGMGTAFGMAALVKHQQHLQRCLLEVADHLVFLNEEALKIAVLNGAPQEKLEVNRLAISSAITRKPGAEIQPTRRPVRFGFLGRLVPVKGIFDLARAVRHLPKNLEFFMEIRGPGLSNEEKEAYPRLRKMLASDPRVIFQEGVSPSQAADVLRSFDVLLIPSRWFENGPTVMYESYAAGTPVVGTRIGAMPETIRDGTNGRLFEPGDWKKLAAIMNEIAMDPAQTVDRWRACLPPTRTMDDIAEQYEALYAQILASVR